MFRYHIVLKRLGPDKKNVENRQRILSGIFSTQRIRRYNVRNTKLSHHHDR